MLLSKAANWFKRCENTQFGKFSDYRRDHFRLQHWNAFKRPKIESKKALCLDLQVLVSRNAISSTLRLKGNIFFLFYLVNHNFYSKGILNCVTILTVRWAFWGKTIHTSSIFHENHFRRKWVLCTEVYLNYLNLTSRIFHYRVFLAFIRCNEALCKILLPHLINQVFLVPVPKLISVLNKQNHKILSITSMYWSVIKISNIVTKQKHAVKKM